MNKSERLTARVRCVCRTGVLDSKASRYGSRYILLKKAIAFFNKTLELTKRNPEHNGIGLTVAWKHT
jgi:hypothetical protein